MAEESKLPMRDERYIRIPLPRRDGSIVASTIISAADAEMILRLRWHLDARGYARRSDVRGVLMHRVILGLKPGDELEGDHRNGDTLDNRRENLRVATHAQNMQNRKANSNGTSRFRNVQWSPDKRCWRVRADVSGERFHVGYFDDELAAALAAHTFRCERMPFARPDAELVRLGIIPPIP